MFRLTGGGRVDEALFDVPILSVPPGMLPTLALSDTEDEESEEAEQPDAGTMIDSESDANETEDTNPLDDVAVHDGVSLQCALRIPSYAGLPKHE